MAAPLTLAVAAAHVSGKGSLLISGAGTLGTLVAKEWILRNPTARVVGETASADRHADLRALGVQPRESGGGAGDETFENLVISFPPREGYVDAVKRALACWDGTGGCILVSSGAVYAEEDGGVVTEASATRASPRTDIIIAAEDAVREAGGSALRLAGLYTADRGPHNYWLAKETIDSWGGGLINLLHYEDAATGVVAALEVRPKGAVLLLSDEEPLSREAIVTAALDARARAGRAQGAPRFVGAEGALGKRYDCSKTRNLLAWKPRHASFREHMAAAAAR